MTKAVTGMRTQRFLLHPEATYGTLEAIIATKLNALRVAVTPAKTVEKFAPQGDALPSLGVLTDDMTNFAFTGKLSFSDVCYVLASLFGYTAPTLLGGIAYQWAFNWDGTQVVEAQSYSVTYGDANFARAIAGLIFNTLGFGVARDGNLQMTSNGFGKALATGAVSYPRESPYTLTITATGGTYTITWSGQTTSAIAFGADGPTILAALVALSNVAPGDLAVTGTGPYTITPTSTGAFAATDVTATIGTGSLTGGTATLAKVRAGGPIVSIPAVPMFPTLFDVYMDPTWASLGSSKIGSIYSMDLGIAERYARTRPIDSTQLNDGYTETAGDDSGQNHTLNFTIAADANGEAQLAKAGGTQQFFRIVANGAANSIDTGHAYLFQWDFAHLVTGFGAYGPVQGGVHAIPVQGSLSKDQTTGNATKILINNKLATL